MAVVIVVSAVIVANAPVVINNHLLLVKVAVIAKTIVTRTIDATIIKATLGITSDTPIPLIPLTPTTLHGEKAR
jgi:hypothetical protein